VAIDNFSLDKPPGVRPARGWTRAAVFARRLSNTRICYQLNSDADSIHRHFGVKTTERFGDGGRL